MFNCHSCLRRAWKALYHDVTIESSQAGFLVPAPQSINQGLTSQRWLSTSIPRPYRRDKKLQVSVKPPQSSTDAPVRYERVRSSHVDEATRKPRRTNREELVNSRRGVLAKNPKTKQVLDEEANTASVEPKQKDAPVTQSEKRRMDRSLLFLGDPLKFSNHIHDLLYKRENVQSALKMVRYASKSRSCVVAWNHIIQWHFKHDKPNAALKLYNEVCPPTVDSTRFANSIQMKKRAQWPDSYTYTHLLSGLVEHWQHPTMLAKALNIYHSMSAENSRVRPLRIHTNLALNMCARTGDMDALWGVASRLADKGPQSADGVTYCIILSAIRRQALESMDTEESNDSLLARHFDEAVLVGCRIWADIHRKWQHGDLEMHDKLVCAMGRLLLLSYQPKAWDAVLSLIERTENIPRMSPVIEDTYSRRVPALSEPSAESPGSVGQLVLQSGAKASQNTDDSSQLDQFRALFATTETTGDAFDRESRNVILALPTNNTISLLMETCQKLMNKKAADSYWKLLTSDKNFQITPDSDNFNCYLRLLRQSKSSNQALRLVQEMPPELLEQKTFRIAMSACVKNAENPLAIDNCANVVDLMQKRLEQPHVPTLIAYMQFAKASKRVPAIVKAIKQVDQIGFNPRTRPFPRTPDEAQRLPKDRRKELLDLAQCMRDSVAWVEGQEEFVKQSGWSDVHWRIMHLSNLFGEKRLNLEDVEVAEPPRAKPRSTSRINARNVRRMFAADAVKVQRDSGLAELPFEVDTIREARV